ncbi:hypothetical protein NQ314_000980 [Rhamnusium bicolor]|uniref:DUF4485 domain-containing protein n=1 Tax=Rhamnusium bicolor TaxID=1586634 RepID=A0AAV8ZWK3_9CUCU|nr:hypothetical protein NQ314_000980 [Rhamnusium bicolor]
MELDAKLDEDFLFYLNFTNTFLKRLTDRETQHRCRVWLFKLCGEPCEGIQRKRCRNMYLAQLLISMQNNHLDRPFLESPHDVDIINATEIFGPIPKNIQFTAIDWLNDSEYDVKSEEPMADKKGRTYIATRTLPNGQGAFAYIGVSLTNEEPMWIGAVEGLLVQLVHDLTEKGQYEQYEQLEEPERRFELLLMLFDRVKTRRDKVNCRCKQRCMSKFSEDDKMWIFKSLYSGKPKNQQDTFLMGLLEAKEIQRPGLEMRNRSKNEKVAKREELLDEIEARNMPKSFFDASEVAPEDKYELPAAMWEQAIDKIPTKKQMESLQIAYPVVLIERFLKSLSDHKEEIAMRMQRRHENIVTQMKKELRKEGEKKKNMAEEADLACGNALLTLAAVKAQYNKKMEAERINSAKYEVPVSEHTKQYEQMKAAVFDTQKLVEEEALRGKFLAAQINAVSEQTEKFIHVNDEMITKTEETNMKIMRNIKRLSAAVRQYESRISDLKSMAANRKKSGQVAFFM